jgi:hypothetical protein
MAPFKSVKTRKHGLKTVGEKAIKGDEGKKKSGMIRSAYKSQKHQQSREKENGRNKAAPIIAPTKMNTSHHVFLYCHHTSLDERLELWH